MDKTLRLLMGCKVSPQWVVNGGADYQSEELLKNLNSDPRLQALLSKAGEINDTLYDANGRYTGFRSDEDKEALRKALSEAEAIAMEIAGKNYVVRDESVLPE